MDWRKLERSVDKTIARHFGESVRLSFMDNGRVDTTRTAVTVADAVLYAEGDEVKPLGDGGGWSTRLSAGECVLILQRGTYTGPPLRTGDRVRANDRDGQPWWEVRSSSDRYSNLIVYALTQVGVGTPA